MMDALQRLLHDESECCLFYSLITGSGPVISDDAVFKDFDRSQISPESQLNESQIKAVESWRNPLSLIWGPPGVYIYEPPVINSIEPIIR